MTGVYTGPPPKGTRKKSARVACVLIIGVTHSLGVFMWLLVITVHVLYVYVSVSVSQRATSNHRKATIIPSIIRGSGLVHTV